MAISLLPLYDGGGLCFCKSFCFIGGCVQAISYGISFFCGYTTKGISSCFFFCPPQALASSFLREIVLNVFRTVLRNFHRGGDSSHVKGDVSFIKMKRTYLILRDAVRGEALLLNVSLAKAGLQGIFGVASILSVCITEVCVGVADVDVQSS